MVFGEIPKSSVSECTWKQGLVAQASSANGWQVAKKNEDPGSDAIPAVYLADGTTLKVAPDHHRSGNKRVFFWKDTYFHDQFKVPLPSAAAAAAAAANSTKDSEDEDARITGGMLLQFQAKAREGITVALSPEASYSTTSSQELFYEVQLGAVGNTTTLLQRRRRGNQNKRQQPNRSTSSKSIPSRVCQDDSWVSYWICFLDGKLYAGIGSTPGQDCIGVLLEEAEEEEESKEDETTEKANEEEAAATIEESKDSTTMDTTTTTTTTTTNNSKPPVIQYVGLGNSAKGPNAQPLSIQKVLLASVPSFVADTLTSLVLPTMEDLPIVVVDGDGTSNEEMKGHMKEYQKECQLRKTRAEKFGTVYKEPSPDEFIPWSKAKRLRENPEKGFITGMDLMDPEEVAKREQRKARFGGLVPTTTTTEEDDDDKKNEETETTTNNNDLPLTQAWDKEDMLRPQRSDPPSSLWKQPPLESSVEERDSFAMEQPEPTTWVPEKIHLFALDWAAFKQIRNKDIMSYFSIYGPSYVEWLADLSCNVCFEDKHTASRAVMSLSQEIPSPPPEDISQEDGTPDFGNMTWRFCKTPLRKVANDRYGKKGTTARVLMRVALSTDILDERPNSWPAPPGGFSSTRVLGPDSDFPKGRGHNNKKRQRKPPKANEQRDASGMQEERGDPPSLLTRGLSAARGGFSVAEMEQERAKKRAKAT